MLIIASILPFLFLSFEKSDNSMSFVLLSVVASIEEFAERYSVPKPFIGLILLPIVVCGSKFFLFSCQVKILSI